MSKKLSSLLEDDTDLHKLKISFKNKLEVTRSFKSKKEFIGQELERIKKEFLESLQISVGGDFRVSHSFNFTEYLNHGYDWLAKGYDYDLDRIYENAKKQYFINESAHLIYNKLEFERAIYIQLLKGATYLRYEKFLNRELIKIANPWWKKTWIIITAAIILIFTLVDFINKSFDLFTNLNPYFAVELSCKT